MGKKEVTLDDIWSGDHLGRRSEAEHLSDYLSRRYQAKKAERGFVLAVNADWGAGKTFMMDRWTKQLELQQYPVVYFDAWENDFSAEPLVAFISSLDKALETRFKSMPAAARLRATWGKAAKAVLVPALKTSGLAIARHVIGREAAEVVAEIKEAMGESALQAEEKSFDVMALGEALNKEVESILCQHASTKAAIATFKEKLTALIQHLEAESGVQLPLFVLIDELDRCRPDYAISLLEGIKHLFGVSGVYFVIATNIPQFSNSIRAVYGERFDAERYLKRFFDLEYELEMADAVGFAKELISRLALPPQLSFVVGFEHSYPTMKPVDYLAFTFERYATSFSLQPRDQEHVARIVEAAMLALGNEEIHVHYLIFLAILYHRDSAVMASWIRAGGFDQTTSSRLLERRAEGAFAVKVPSRAGMGEMEEKAVDVTSITAQYVSIMRSGGAPQNINTFDFPTNLQNKIYQDTRNGRLQRYEGIVKRAGRFKS